MTKFTSFIAKPAAALGAVALALSVPIPAIGTQTAVAQSSSELAQVANAVRGIKTMKADFIQSDRNGQRVSGVMTLKQPGKIRFQYEKDVPILIVSDGKALTMVDYEVNQVQRWPIKNSPLGALLDPERDIKRYGKLVPTTNPDVLSIEVRDPKRPEFGVITLVMVRKASAPGGLELTNWVALDSQNKRTTVRLSNHRYGVAVSNNDFKFRDPRPRSRR